MERLVVMQEMAV
jgi:hypothetical protein